MEATTEFSRNLHPHAACCAEPLEELSHPLERLSSKDSEQNYDAPFVASTVRHAGPMGRTERT